MISTDNFDIDYLYDFVIIIDMKDIKATKTKAKRDIGYKIFYISGIAIIAVVGILSNSYFAYQFFNSLFFSILLLVLIVAMLVVRSIQTYLRQTTLYGKIFILVYFNMFALAFTMQPFVSSRIWAIILFSSFIVALILLIILAFRYIKAPSNYCITPYEPIVAVLPLLTLLLFASRQNYISGQSMWLPVVIGGAILSICALLVFLKYFKDIEHFEKSKGELIMSCILLVLVCFALVFVSISTINYAFDSSPTSLTVQVSDKDIQAGTRQATSFYLKVKLDDEEIKIEVPVVVYHNTEIGDNIEIKLYNGALGYSYYIYE